MHGWLTRPGHTWLLTAAMASAALMTAPEGSAQSSARRVVAVTQQPTPQERKGARRNEVATKAEQPPETPAPPPQPQWPVNDPPQQASVVWSAQGLSIDARNSSLQQILNQISSQTGVKIEGAGEDERVFGVYGPGDPREVLSELLEGSGYNVLMVGLGERGTPQQIVLSVRPEGGTEPNAPVSPGDLFQPPVAPYQPPAPIRRPNNGPPQPPQPRTPQQILQELQQRQQQMREEQMRQQMQGQPNQQPEEQEAPQQEQ